MKNESLLEQWEKIVQKENMVPWKATTSSRICSNHFEPTDYIIPPSSSTPFRLKPNALPSIFPPHEFEEQINCIAKQVRVPEQTSTILN